MQPQRMGLHLLLFFSTIKTTRIVNYLTLLTTNDT